jgi:hypothetical protein
MASEGRQETSEEDGRMVVQRQRIGRRAGTRLS